MDARFRPADTGRGVPPDIERSSSRSCPPGCLDHIRLNDVDGRQREVHHYRPQRQGFEFLAGRQYHGDRELPCQPDHHLGCLRKTISGNVVTFRLGALAGTVS